MRLYALSQRSMMTYDAAGKAIRDVYAVLQTKKAKIIWSMPKSVKKLFKILDLPYLFLFLLFQAGKEDCIFYSVPENHIKIKLLKALRKIKKYKIICFINDLIYVRQGDFSSDVAKKRIAKEIAEVSMADYVLAPNNNAVRMLRDYGVKSEIVPVGVWDYIMPEDMSYEIAMRQKKVNEEINQNGKTQIAYAGNLNKAEFLSKIPFGQETDIELQLWGLINEERIATQSAVCHYHGKLPAEELPLEICTLDYGLVWDGSGADYMEGSFGSYARYCNAHKCGLYLSSGVPVIIWREGGSADFVREHQCGICVDRLGELPEKIKNADYETIKKNALEVAVKLRQGACLSFALDRVIELHEEWLRNS